MSQSNDITLRGVIDECKRANKKLSEELAYYKDINADLERELNGYKDANRNLLEEISANKGGITQLREEAEKAMKHIKSLEATNRLLKGNQESLKLEREGVMKSYQDISNKHDSLEKEYKELREDYENIVSFRPLILEALRLYEVDTLHRISSLASNVQELTKMNDIFKTATRIVVVQDTFRNLQSTLIPCSV